MGRLVRRAGRGGAYLALFELRVVHSADRGDCDQARGAEEGFGGE